MYIFNIIYKKNISENNIEDLLELFIYHMCNIFGDNYTMYFNLYQIVIKIPDKHSISITDIASMKKDLDEFLEIPCIVNHDKIYNLKTFTIIQVKDGARE
jgi:hypothetical protein